MNDGQADDFETLEPQTERRAQDGQLMVDRANRDGERLPVLNLGREYRARDGRGPAPGKETLGRHEPGVDLAEIAPIGRLVMDSEIV